MLKRPLYSRLARVAGACALAMLSTLTQAQTALADQPLFTNNAIPGNLALALSVEFPTAVSVAHIGEYSAARTYLGYFDAGKCYTYRSSTNDSTLAPNTAAPDSYFFPDGLATAAHTCASKWSGNFLNWATMQTIDPFRWALTGGYRVIDTASLTVLEKAWASGQGGTGNFPNRAIDDTTTLTGATPLSGLSRVRTRIQGLGNVLRFSSRSANLDNGTARIHYDNSNGTTGTVYEVFVRVKVCDNSGGAGGLETNCRAYGSNHKPEGLIQRYSDRIRYSAFGYMNDDNILRDAGVLRARQKFVGPTNPVPGSPAVTNGRREWDSATGVFEINPDATDASDTATLFSTPVANSGVINYLNKFGRSSNAYKTYDPVGELYYAAVRYFKGLGNVPEWTAVGTANAATRATWVDNFPVITTWDDPIQYSCQRNFILGIGDTNTHADANVPGTGTPTGNEPTKPSLGDTFSAVTATNRIGLLEGIGGGSLGTVNPYGGCCNNNTALMAGIAYDAHTRDIRPDVNTDIRTLGMQTISTYWLDVMEYGVVTPNNQFLLAAKYGGFEVPQGFNMYTNTTPLTESWWHTNTDNLPANAPANTPRPDNYFTAGEPAQMIAGLNSAFSDIASRIRAYTTSFSTTLPQVSQLGNGSYSTQFDSQTWTGEVQANILNFNTVTGDPELIPTASWIFSDELATQAAGTGWNTNRRIASWDPVSRTAVAFRSSGGSRLTSAQLNTLDTTYAPGDDSTNYLNYLRGERTNEGTYRVRAKLLGDISGSKSVPVGQPDYPFTDGYNLGYSAFKGTYATRRTVVYVGANDGMLHAINGALQRTMPTPTNTIETDANAGREMFAYVPSAVFPGPNNTPAVDGLASLGRSPLNHKYFVNATPVTFDVDFWRTPTPTATAPDWRTILVGGLGKGGKGYYALDVTDPENMATSEANLVSKVLWEFTDPDMGYTYGDALISKTRKYGWVVVLASGYNNADGRGYLFFVNPRTGELLEKIATPTASNGMAHLNGFVETYRDGTMDAVYSVDLDGNIWRVDVTATSGPYPAPQLFAVVTDGSGVRQPLTSKPIIEVDPRSNRRFVMQGTGRLLDSTDIALTQANDFYAITDGMRNFGGFATIGGTPVGRSNLRPVLTDAELLTGVTVDYLTQRGWYIPLGQRRVLTRPSSYYGSVTFVATAVDTADPCSPGGVSRIYGVDFSNALSLLRSVTNDALPYLQTASNITDIKDLSVNGRRAIIYGDDRGGLNQARSAPAPAQASRRLNWREVQD